MATAIGMGSRNRYAGLALGVGHLIIELPLVLLIMLGMDRLLKSTGAQVVIGLAGGALLIMMAIQMMISLKAETKFEGKVVKGKAVWAGLILSVSNPYFVFWWATIGLALANDAREFGVWAFGLFAIVHWLCDFVCFGALAWASFKGSTWLGSSGQRMVLLICSGALGLLGLMFIYKAVVTLIELAYF
jgi:threonine/homoserine/homoserine lactone efflux protein